MVEPHLQQHVGGDGADHTHEVFRVKRVKPGPDLDQIHAQLFHLANPD